MRESGDPHLAIRRDVLARLVYTMLTSFVALEGYYSLSARLEPDNPSHRFRAANALMDIVSDQHLLEVVLIPELQGYSQKAIAAFQRALRDGGHNCNVENNLGNAFMAMVRRAE